MGLLLLVLLAALAWAVKARHPSQPKFMAQTQITITIPVLLYSEIEYNNQYYIGLTNKLSTVTVCVGYTPLVGISSFWEGKAC